MDIHVFKDDDGNNIASKPDIAAVLNVNPKVLMVTFRDIVNGREYEQLSNQAKQAYEGRG